MHVKNLVNKVINFFGKTNNNGGGGRDGVWSIVRNGSAMAPLFFPLWIWTTFVLFLDLFPKREYVINETCEVASVNNHNSLYMAVILTR